MVQNTARPRAPRTRRDEAKDHMVSAATDLLRIRQPEDVSVRDVADRAGHHHRFVASWFGGKSGLFLEAFERLTIEAASVVALPSAHGLQGSITPEVVRVVQLMNWLVADDPSVFADRRSTPLIDRVARAYGEVFDLEPDFARLAAQRLMAGAISVVLFSDPLGIGPDEVGRLIELEMRIGHALKGLQSRPAPIPVREAVTRNVLADRKSE